MAKYERKLKTNIDELLSVIEDGILNGSVSAQIEEKSDFTEGDARCCVRAFERYSIIGSNRLALNVTLFQAKEGEVYLSATSTGGSQGVFFKINTWGEEAFIQNLKEVVVSKYGVEKEDEK